MARQPQVTRTIQTTKVSVLVVDTSCGKTFVEERTLPRTYKDNKAILKTLEKLNTNDTMKPVHVISVEVQETLYGMSEAKFIQFADVLPDRVKRDEADAN